MDQTVIAHMRREEQDLLRKLEAVRQLLAVYGEPANEAPMKATATASQPRPVRASSVDRTDKFGAYGQRIIDAATRHLPEMGGNPMMTRDLLAKLDEDGIEVRGENKINALSALLARSSTIKGYGRAGWTLTRARPLEVEQMLGSNDTGQEKEPHSASAGGSDAGTQDASTSPFHRIDL